MQHEIDDKRIAGAVTLVVRQGKVAWFKAQGMADREAGKTMPTDAMFRICSMTKPITSVAVMMLYEEGKFLLDDPVSKYLPEFKNAEGAGQTGEGRALHDSSYEMRSRFGICCGTLRGSRTSGTKISGRCTRRRTSPSGLLQYDGTIADSVKHLAALPLLFNPGDRFEYSLGVDVSGAAGGSGIGKTAG